MPEFRNIKDKRTKELATSVLNQYHSGENIDIIELTESVSYLLRNYHNQKGDPNSFWIAENEIKELKELLHVLIKGIEELEGV